MINFIKKIFGFSKKKEQKKPSVTKKVSEHVIDHDMVDYDGMGNQGRFPTH